MRYRELVKSVQRQMGSRLSYHTLDIVLRACFAVITRTLEQEETVNIPEFGCFEMTTTKSRVVVSNLKDETRYQVPERKRVRFVPSDIWIQQLNGKNRG